MLRNVNKFVRNAVATRPVSRIQPGVYTLHKRNYMEENNQHRYYDEGDNYVAEKARIVDNTYILASNIIERPPLCHPKAPKWEMDWYSYKVAKESETACVLPKDMADGLYGKLMRPDDMLPNPHPHISEDDLSGDVRSIYRKLDEPVYLIVKVKQEIDPKLPKTIWCFPTTEVREGETIRSAAERTVFYHLGEINTYTLGNAPILHNHYEGVPEPIKKDYPNVTKVSNYFMHSIYLKGKYEIEEGSDVLDYAWVAQSELENYFIDPLTKPLVPLCSSSLAYVRPE